MRFGFFSRLVYRLGSSPNGDNIAAGIATFAVNAAAVSEAAKEYLNKKNPPLQPQKPPIRRY